MPRKPHDGIELVSESNERMLRAQMTINEALVIVRRFPQTLVTWRSDTCEIVEVNPISDKTGPLQYPSGPLQRAWTTEDGLPYASRYFNWVNLTAVELREDLCRLVDENRLHEIFKEWQFQPAGELISIFETGNFPCPTFRRDTDRLLNCLLDFHQQELSEMLTARLWRLLEVGSFDRANDIDLRFRLYVHEQRTNDFIEYWVKLRNEQFPLRLGSIEGAGNLRVMDERIVGDLIKSLQNRRIKRDAMIALGKIGSSAGQEAASAIKQIDGGRITTRERDRVVQRILTTEEEWKQCGVCQSGKVLDRSKEWLHWQDCSECYSLGWIPKS